jgi:hypothetical protein
MRRAQRWDGIVPLTPHGEPLTPDGLREVLAYTGTRDGWDVVATGAPGVPVAGYAEAGATWYVESTWPEGEWYADLRTQINAGPPSL